MRGAMFKPTALLVWGVFALAGVWGGNTCLAADGAPGDAPPAEAAPPVLPMPESTPDGWTDAQFAALKRMEIRVKHTDTQQAYTVGFGIWLKITPFDPAPVQGEPQLRVRVINMDTNFGRVFAPIAGNALEEELRRSKNTMISSYRYQENANKTLPENIHIHNATADILPYFDAPASLMLRNLDVSGLLRSTPPLPEVRIVGPKGRLPVAPPEMLRSKTPEEVKNADPHPLPENVLVHLADVFMKPDEPGVVYYELEMDLLPHGSSLHQFTVQTNLGYRRDNGHAIGLSVTHGVKGGTKRITIRSVAGRLGWIGNDTYKSWMSKVLLKPFTPLPFITDKGPLPLSPSGLSGP